MFLNLRLILVTGSCIILILCDICLCDNQTNFSSSYNNGLIFYNPLTKLKILPPVILPLLPNRPVLRMPFIGMPCSCQHAICGCCAGILMQEYNIDQKMCVNASYISLDSSLNMYVLLNENNIMTSTFSARNPPPLCMPLMMPIPLALCLRFTDMRFDDYNVHFCMDWVVRMGMTNDLFEMHFNCVKMGQQGVQYIDMTGQPVFPNNGNGFGKILEILSTIPLNTTTLLP